MGDTTYYQVQLEYLVNDRASQGVRGIDTATQNAARSASTLHGALGKIAAAASAFVGFQAAKKAFVEFNDSMEQAQIQMAGMLQMNLGGPFAQNMQKAVDLTAKLQQHAKESLGTTADMVAMASNLAQPLTRAGGSMEDLERMTASTVVAAKAMGVEAGAAARDIDQALRGQYHSIDQFTGKLLAPRGFGGEDGRRRFNALSDEKKLAELRSALSQKAIDDMAKAQAKSWQGQWSTFVDTVQMGFGRAGRSLFERVKDAMRAVNEWIKTNSAALEMMGQRLGHSLTTAFDVGKQMFEMVARHKDTLMAIAGAFAGLKGINLARGLAGGLGGGGGRGGMLGGALGLGLGAAAAVGLSEVEKEAHYRASARDLAELADASKLFVEASAEAAKLKQMKQWSPYQGYGKMPGELQGRFASSAEQMMEKFRAFGMTSADDFAKIHSQLYGLGSALDAASFRDVTGREQMAVQRTMEAAFKAFEEHVSYLTNEGYRKREENPWAERKPVSANFIQKIDIHRIEVASDDPDRFVMNTLAAFTQMSTSPGQAMRMLRKG